MMQHEESGLDFFHGVQENIDDSSYHRKQYSLNQENEFRFEVRKTDNVTIKVLKGQAEIFGTELALDQEYVFSGATGCVGTWHGCDLEVVGRPAHAYVESDTTMRDTCAIHTVLDARRRVAFDSDQAGPRVLVVGPQDSGKSTVVRTLLAYSTRLQWRPILVDADLGAGLLSVPGSLAAAAVDRPPMVNEGFETDESVQYFYGSMDGDHNTDLRQLLFQNLAQSIDNRLAREGPKERAAGCIIDTGGVQQDLGFVLGLVDALRVDVIVALNQRLFRDLQQHYTERKELSVAMLRPSGGVTACGAGARPPREMLLKETIREYFYGNDKEVSFSPKRQVESFVDLQIYRIGGGNMSALPASALPLGEEQAVDKLELIPAMKTRDTLRFALCAVSLATQLVDVKSAPVAGYIHISEVDMAKQTITFLAPSSGLPAAGIIILSGMKWQEI